MKAAIAVLLLVVSAGFLCAQGTVTFQNNGAIFGDPVGVTVDRKVYSGWVGGGAGLTGTNWAAQLWYDFGNGMAPVPDAIRLFRLPTTSLPGTWNTAPTPTVVLPGVDIGQTAQLEVRVWDIQKFESYGAALAGQGALGRSQPFSYIVPQPGSADSEYTLKGLRAFYFFDVPEPSAVGLLASATVFLMTGRRIASRGRRQAEHKADPGDGEW